MIFDRLPQTIDDGAALGNRVKLQDLVELPVRRRYFEGMHRWMREVDVERSACLGELPQIDERFDPTGAVERGERLVLLFESLLAPVERGGDLRRDRFGGLWTPLTPSVA